MTDAIKEIRLELHRFMNKHHGCSVVWSDRTATVPKKPYATIKLISTTPESQSTRDEHRWQDGKNIRYQVRYYKQSLSITVYQEDDQRENNTESLDLANEIRRWFEIYAELILERLDVVVTNIGSVNDRTTFLVDSYDYKRGFDVALRVTGTDDYINLYQDNDKYKYDIIESVEITPHEQPTIIINKED